MRRSGGAHRNLFGGRFRRVKGSKRYSSDEDDDETLLFSNENNTYTSNNTLVEVASGRAKKAWRTLPINTPEQILAGEDSTCYVVFPAGIYLQIVSNPNPCDMVLSFQLEDFIDKDPAVIVPSMGAVHDVEILPPPPEDGPRSQKWCELFGIITESNLGKGIVERKENGDLVVWRKFRHNVELLTPFAMFKHRELDSSTSPYMFYSEEDYAKLLQACRGIQVDKITVTAKPLFSKFETLDLKPIHLELLNPAVVSSAVPDSTDSDSYVVDNGTVIQHIPISPNTENQIIDFDDQEDNILENIAQYAIDNESTTFT